MPYMVKKDSSDQLFKSYMPLYALYGEKKGRTATQLNLFYLDESGCKNNLCAYVVKKRGAPRPNYMSFVLIRVGVKIIYVPMW